MNRLKKLLSFSLLFLLAGCGPPGDSLESIRQSGKFTVAGSGGYPPFNFYQNDQVVGFDVDTGYAIAEKLGVELDYITSDWDGLIEGLRAGRYHAILGSMAITEQRQQVVAFTVPYYYSGAQLVVRREPDGQHLRPEDMAGKSIAVVTATNFVVDAENLDAEPVYYQDDNQTFTELINGRVDGVISDRMVALKAINEIAGGENLVLSGDLLRLEEMALAVRKDDHNLLQRLNQIIEALHERGEMSAISRKWHDGADISRR